MRTQIGIWSAILTVSIAFQSSVWAQTFHALGFLPDGNSSYAWSVSVNGVVVGQANSTGGDYAFRWSASTGMVNLSSPSTGVAYGISANGRVVVGYARSQGFPQAVLWDQSVGRIWLGSLGGVASEARAVSGTFWATARTVGLWVTSGGQLRAFRTNPGPSMQDLGTLPGGTGSDAYDLSADGSVVVGLAYDSSGRRRAFRYADGSGMVDLGTLGGVNSWARAVSADGSVVVGWADAPNGTFAFRWTLSSGMQSLGTLRGAVGSGAYDVSADGSIIVGSASFPFGVNRAVSWIVSGNTALIRDLNAVYASIIPSGWSLEVATTVSADGRYIAGYGVDPEGRTQAWMIDTGGSSSPAVGDVNGDGCVNDADLLLVLFNFGSGC